MHIPRLLTFTIVVAAAFCCRADDEPAARRYALLVGCTRYENLPSSLQLEGPANDVQLFRRLLVNRYGFRDADIVTLSEAGGDQLRPTGAHIRRELNRLICRVRKGDQAVLFFAGHGSQQPDDDPDNEQDPEPDGLDEVFLPADCGKWANSSQCIANAICDDEVRQWLARLQCRGVAVCIVFDACHSGTAIRGTGAEVTRQVPPDELVPDTVLEKARGDRPAGLFDASERRDAPRSSDSGLVAMYASRSHEPTFEASFPPLAKGRDQTKYGLFTYTLCEVLSRARSPMTYTELTERVHAEYVRTGRSYPIPLVEGGDRHRFVLGRQQPAARAQFLLSVGPAGMRVNAGAIHGLTAGCVLAVSPPAGAAGAKEVLGHVRVTGVRALEADVEPCAYRGAPLARGLPQGARARIVYFDYNLRPLKLLLDPPPAAEDARRPLLDLIQKQAARDDAQWRLTKRAEKADWVLRFAKGGASLVPASGWQRAAGQTTRKEAQRAAAADKAFGPAAVDETLPAWLSDRLTRIARVNNLLSLSRPLEEVRPPGGLSVNIQVEVLRCTSAENRDGQPIAWQEAGRVVKAGELIAFRVKNQSRVPVYVTMLYLDSQYGILPFFPRQFGSNNFIPSNADYTTRVVRVSPRTTGLERMLVIATKAEGEPVDFTWLAQPTIEAARETSARRSAGTAPLAELLERAGFGAGGPRGWDVLRADHEIRTISFRVSN